VIRLDVWDWTNVGDIAGRSPKTASSVLGVPVGLELMGRRWEDDELLDIAERAERILKGRLAPVLY
jgi:amidase